MTEKTPQPPREYLDAAMGHVLRREVKLNPADTLAQLPGWNSLAMVQLVLKVQAERCISISGREVAALRTVGDLLALLDPSADGSAR